MTPAARMEAWPPALLAIATDPRYSLRDGRFEEVRIDIDERRVLLAINIGDLQVGYRRLELSFDDARIVPDDYQRLSSAIRAEFRPDHWHRGRTVTEVRDQTVRQLDDGRFRITLRLWPFHTFAIEFDGVDFSETPRAERGPERPARIHVRRVERGHRPKS